MGELVTAMAAYLGEVAAHLNARLGGGRGNDRSIGEVRPVPKAVRDWFDACEKLGSWERLGRACSDAFSGKGHSRNEGTWDHALRNWMRRTKVYLRLLQGSHPDPSEVVGELSADLDAPEDRVVFLVLLEGVSFAETKIDLDECQVVRPTTQEVETLLTTSVNRVFYPEAVSSSERLTDHWYLRCETRKPRRKIGVVTLPEGFWKSLVRRTYTTFDPSVERVLKRIILWDWQVVARLLWKKEWRILPVNWGWLTQRRPPGKAATGGMRHGREYQERGAAA